MNELSGYEEYAWIGTRKGPLPDVCCTCGMFTDQRIVIKRKVAIREDVNNSASVLVVLGILLGVFLGPLGWLLSLFLGSRGEVDEEGRVLVKKNLKARVPRCQLCSGSTELTVVDHQGNPPQLLIQVHPRFKQRLDEVRRLAETDDSSENGFN